MSAEAFAETLDFGAACGATPDLPPSIYSEEAARSPRHWSHSACSTILTTNEAKKMGTEPIPSCWAYFPKILGSKLAPKIEDDAENDRKWRKDSLNLCVDAFEVVRQFAEILVETSNRPPPFDIAADGGLSSRRVWRDLGSGVPDGICIDADNAVWYGDVSNKRCGHVREGGEVPQTVELERFACMPGGADGRTFIRRSYRVAWHGEHRRSCASANATEIDRRGARSGLRLGPGTGGWIRRHGIGELATDAMFNHSKSTSGEKVWCACPNREGSRVFGIADKHTA